MGEIRILLIGFLLIGLSIQKDINFKGNDIQPTLLSFDQGFDDELTFNKTNYYLIECKQQKSGQVVNACLEKSKFYVQYEFYEDNQLIQWKLFHPEVDIYYQQEGDEVNKFRKFPAIPLQGNNLYQLFNLTLAGQNVERFLVLVKNTKEVNVITYMSLYLENYNLQRLAYQLPFIQVDGKQTLEDKWFSIEVPTNSHVKLDLDICYLGRDLTINIYKSEEELAELTKAASTSEKKQPLQIELLRSENPKSSFSFMIDTTDHSSKKNVKTDLENPEDNNNNNDGNGDEEGVQTVYLHMDYKSHVKSENGQNGEPQVKLPPNIYSIKSTIFAKPITKEVWSHFKLPGKIDPKVVYLRTDDDQYEIQFNGLQFVDPSSAPEGLKYVLYEIHVSDDVQNLPILTYCDLTANEIQKVGLSNPYSIHYKFYHYVDVTKGDQLPARIAMSQSQLFGDDLIFLDRIYISVKAVIELPEHPQLYDQYHIIVFPQIEKFVYTRQVIQQLYEFLNFHNEFIFFEIIGALILIVILSKGIQFYFRSQQNRSSAQPVKQINPYNPIKLNQ